MIRTVAVLNAHGAQARAIANRLGHAGFEVRRLSRTAAPGVVAVDPTDADAIARGLEGVDAAVFTTPQDYRPGAREGYAERVTAAAERAGLSRIVLNTAGAVYEDSDLPIATVGRALRATVLGGAVPAVVIQPTAYLDNLVEPWAIPAIVDEGVLAYPTPAGGGVSWLSHDSLGDFAAAALRAEGVEGRVFDVGGPAALTGDELAAAVGAAAGRPVRFVEAPLDQLAASLNAAFGAPAGDHIAGLYAYARENPAAMNRDPAGWAALEVAPESVEAWAGRQAWRLPAIA